MAFTSGVNAACIVAVALVVIICNVSGQSDFGGVPLNRLKRAAPVSGISDGKEKLEVRAVFFDIFISKVQLVLSFYKLIPGFFMFSGLKSG